MRWIDPGSSLEPLVRSRIVVLLFGAAVCACGAPGRMPDSAKLLRRDLEWARRSRVIIVNPERREPDPVGMTSTTEP